MARPHGHTRLLVPLRVDVARRDLDWRVLLLVEFKLIRTCEPELLRVSLKLSLRRVLEAGLGVFVDRLVEILLAVLSDVAEHNDRAGRAVLLLALLQPTYLLLVDSGQLGYLLLLGSSFLGQRGNLV